MGDEAKGETGVIKKKHPEKALGDKNNICNSDDLNDKLGQAEVFWEKHRDQKGRNRAMLGKGEREASRTVQLSSKKTEDLGKGFPKD